jgi:hypothetical protein
MFYPHQQSLSLSTLVVLTRCRFGFAKFYDVRDSELCIRAFHRLGYEIGFARVRFSHAFLLSPPLSARALANFL